MVVNKTLHYYKEQGCSRLRNRMPPFLARWKYFWGLTFFLGDYEIFKKKCYLFSLAETIGGMLDLEPRLWREPKKEPFELQKKKVLAFGSKWRKFDISRQTRAESSSSSSSSDNEWSLIFLVKPKQNHHLTTSEVMRDLSSLPIRLFSILVRHLLVLFSCKRLEVKKGI